MKAHNLSRHSNFASRKARLLRSVLTVMLLLATAPPAVQAQDWDDGAGETTKKWSTAANWDPDTVPVAGDDVRIGNIFPSYADTVEYDVLSIQPIAYGSLILSNGVTLDKKAGGQFDVAGDLTLNGGLAGVEMIVRGGFFPEVEAGAIQLNNNSTFTLSGGAVETPGGITVGPDAVLAFAAESTAFGAAEIQDGGAVIVDGTVDVQANAQILPAVDFNASAETIVAADKTLDLHGHTDYFGGSYTGEGTISHIHDAHIRSDTVIDAGRFDVERFLLLDADLTVNSEFGSGSDNEMSATISIEEPIILTVNSDSRWKQTGPLNVDFAAGTAEIRGSNFALEGDVVLEEALRLRARTELSGDVLTTSPFGTLGFDGGNLNNRNKIVGSQITGMGLVEIGDDKAVDGYGDINIDFNGRPDSQLMAKDGRLRMGGTLLGFSTLGTADATGILEITNAWDTGLGDQVVLNGGELTGAGIINTNRIEGFGEITANGLLNDGTLEAKGGTMTLSTTAALPDLDGPGEMGTLTATGGSLRVTTPLADPFHSVARVGAGQSLTFDQGWNFAAIGVLDMQGGPGNPAVVAGGLQTLRGRVDVTNDAQFGAPTSFDPAVRVNLPASTDELTVTADSTIAAGATFAGEGTLRNAEGATMQIADTATVEVALDNEGTLLIGNSSGSVGIHQLELGHTSSVEIELAGLLAGAEHDRINVTEDATLSGELDLELLPGFVPAYGDQFVIMQTGGSVMGTFDLITDLQIAGEDKSLAVIYEPSQVSIITVLPGDANADGLIDVSDFNIWNDNKFQDEGTWTGGDFNGDGLVDVADLNIWNAHKFTAVNAADGIPAVPEPSGMLWLAVCGVAGCGTRRKGHRDRIGASTIAI